MIRKAYFAFAMVVPLAVGLASLWWPPVLWALVPVLPIVLLGLHDVLQGSHALLRVYPVIGHGRYLLEAFRPEIQQYFVESNIDGAPFSREFRSLIYQRAKGAIDTMPFGTQRDVNRPGYEFVNHSLSPKFREPAMHRVEVGGPQCRRPYSASHLNISAMSFGALSKNAILALNTAAKIGDFAHNTGEGGLSPYHLQPGGDLIWQIGTGYFGCRTCDGEFDPGLFRENASRDAVKMIEIKLSQGAKPGHGGILPAAKVTAEIAAIRNVRMGHDVVSPPAHTRFSNPSGLLEFVAELRELSGGKPVGFKLCVGMRSEFLGVCKAMLETEILPDFITVDGSEGGTGAAPVELSNSVGTPFRVGLTFVHDALRGTGLRDRIRIIGAAKIATGFHIFRAIALGADLCNAARPMMFALGCIQARRCNDNTCPVGVATQDPSRYLGLVVDDKAPRVARYHTATVKSFLELLGAAGLDTSADIRPEHLLRKFDAFTVKSVAELHPCLPEGALIDAGGPPRDWLADWQQASPDRF